MLVAVKAVNVTESLCLVEVRTTELELRETCPPAPAQEMVMVKVWVKTRRFGSEMVMVPVWPTNSSFVPVAVT